MEDAPPPHEAFAEAVAKTLKEQQRSVAWLSRQIDANPSTIGYQLRRPGAMTLRNACAIRDALGVNL